MSLRKTLNRNRKHSTVYTNLRELHRQELVAHWFPGCRKKLGSPAFFKTQRSSTWKGRVDTLINDSLAEEHKRVLKESRIFLRALARVSLMQCHARAGAPHFWGHTRAPHAAWVALYNKQLVVHEREKNENGEEREICQTIRAVKRREHDRWGLGLRLKMACMRACVTASSVGKSAFLDCSKM